MDRGSSSPFAAPLVIIGTLVSAFSNAQVFGASMSIVASWADGNVLGRAVSWTLVLAGDVGYTSNSAIFSALQAVYDRRSQPEQHAIAPFQARLPGTPPLTAFCAYASRMPPWRRLRNGCDVTRAPLLLSSMDAVYAAAAPR